MAGEEWAVLADFATLPASPESRAALLGAVPLPRLLELLQANGARMDVLCKCLEKLLCAEDADSRQILRGPDGARMLPIGFGHPDERVRLFCVRVVGGLVSCDEDIKWLEDHGLVFDLVCATTDTVLAVGNAACNVLVKAVACPAGVAAVFAANCCEQLQVRMSDAGAGAAASVIRMRVLELLCRLWAASPAAAERCKALGVKQQLIDIIEGDDILLQLNAVEVLAQLPAQDVGEDLLAQLLATAEAMVGGGAVPARLLACVASFVAHDSAGVPGSLEARFCELLASRLAAARPASDAAVDLLDILAALTATPRGLCALSRCGQLAPAAAQLAPALRGQHQASKLSALEVVQHATRSAAHASFHTRSTEGGAAVGVQGAGAGGHEAEAGAVVERVVRALVPVLVPLTRTAILEERVGALCACRAIAMHSWGAQALFAEAGFLALVVDRQAEACKRSLEEKYGLVRAALALPDLPDIVGTDNHRVLVAFAADGAFYTSPAARDTNPQIASMSSG